MAGGPSLRMPAEWEPHHATWIAWPHRRDDWPGKFTPIPWVYTEIIRHLHTSEIVRILVNDGNAEKRATAILQKASVDLRRIEFYRIPTDRSWSRDYGPMFAKSREGVAIVDWKFNAWAKYTDWKSDDRVAQQVSRRLARSIKRPAVRGQRVVMEGGAIDVNGEGLLLATEECLQSSVQQRNPGLATQDLESVLREFMGARKVLWLGRGIAGDDTHGHVDDIARFVSPRTVVTVLESDTDDENFEPLQDNLRRLRAMTDRSGNRLDVVTMPMPAAVYFDGRRLPASYANFYIANEVVLVPTFNDVKDRIALGLLADLFPTRRVVGIHAVDLVWGLGTIHCLTQQEPA